MDIISLEKNMNKYVRVLHSLCPSKILVLMFDLNINNAGYHVQCLNREKCMYFLVKALE
jgi:hypothetical protein